MSQSVKEKLHQINSSSGDTRIEGELPHLVQEEQPQLKRGRKRRIDKDLKSVTFKWTWDLDARLAHYVADLERQKHRVVERTEIVIKAVEEFLKREGY